MDSSVHPVYKKKTSLLGTTRKLRKLLGTLNDMLKVNLNCRYKQFADLNGKMLSLQRKRFP